MRAVSVADGAVEALFAECVATLAGDIKMKLNKYIN
jgi:hypothetical protein